MVSIIRFADILLLLLVVNCSSSIRVDDQQSNGPLVFTKWPPVKQYNKPPPSLRNQLMYHIRSHRRVPPGAMRKRFHSMPISSHSMPQQRVMRPMKMPMMPHYMSKGVMYQVYKPTMSTPQRINFQSSPPGPNTGEYVYENPFASMPMPPNKKKVSITGENKFTPIKTIPAPNLAYSVGNERIIEPIVDNQLNERENYNAFNMLSPGNYHQQYQMSLNVDDIHNNNDNNNYNIQHQYQVTEPTTDHMIHDPIPMSSAEQSIYAHSANQVVPLYKLSQAYDVFNQHTANTKPIPIPLFINGPNQVQSTPESSSLIQLTNTIPQQQLPDTYALPISNQPQLQQHLLQQQSMMQNAPMSVYNPTYLVTQSNNLLSQHRERLFKPAPAFLGTMNQPTIDLSPNEVQPFDDVKSVASAGQIQTSNQKQAEATPAPTTSNDLLSSVAVSTNSFPKFERFTAQRPAISASNDIIFGQSNGVSHVRQPILTEQEVASYLNFDGTQNSNNNNVGNQGFIASTFYQAQPDPQVEIENSHRQRLNDLTISQANAEIRQRFPASLSTAKPNSRKKNAHEEHQKKLAQQFGNKEQLRIFVPDESNSNEKKNELRRSDNDFLNAVHENVSAEDELEQPTHQYNNEDANEVTTDGSEEYFMHDTESVDRLAMDGETSDPLNSSTLAIDRNYY